MIRKHVRISKRQQMLLTKLARARGVSESEVIRQAIEHEAADPGRQHFARDRSAWEEIVRTIEARMSLDVEATPYEWDRRDAYEEREGRWPRQANPDAPGRSLIGKKPST